MLRKRANFSTKVRFTHIVVLSSPFHTLFFNQSLLCPPLVSCQSCRREKFMAQTDGSLSLRISALKTGFTASSALYNRPKQLSSVDDQVLLVVSSQRRTAEQYREKLKNMYLLHFASLVSDYQEYVNNPTNQTVQRTTAVVKLVYVFIFSSFQKALGRQMMNT